MDFRKEKKQTIHDQLDKKKLKALQEAGRKTKITIYDLENPKEASKAGSNAVFYSFKFIKKNGPKGTFLVGISINKTLAGRWLPDIELVRMMDGTVVDTVNASPKLLIREFMMGENSERKQERIQKIAKGSFRKESTLLGFFNALQRAVSAKFGRRKRKKYRGIKS